MIRRVCSVCYLTRRKVKTAVAQHRTYWLCQSHCNQAGKKTVGSFYGHKSGR